MKSKKKKHFQTTIILQFILLLFTLSCSKDTISKKTTKTLHLAACDDPVTLDPRKGGDALSATFQFFLFEGLVALHPDGSITPAQCSSYSVSNDQKTYTFTLGETHWSDGSVVTSYDFANAWKEMLSPTFASPNAHLLYSIKNAEEAKKGFISLDEVGILAKDANTLIIELKEPTPHFLSVISFCVFSPVKAPFIEKKPICNGPFILSKWSHRKEILLEKNPFFRANKETNIESIHVSVVNSDSTILQMYENGELDLIGDPFANIPQNAIQNLPKDQLLNCPLAATTFISFNIEKKPFSNKNIRRAFNLAINRKEIIETVMEFGESPAFCAIPPSLKKQKNTHLYEDSNTNKAKEFLSMGLKELGMKKTEFEQSIAYTYSHTPITHSIAQILQQQWLTNLEVHINLENADPKTLMAKLSKRTYSFGQTLYRAQYFDPLSILERFQHKANVKNYPGWENAAFTKLLLQSATESGEKRCNTLLEAEQILLEEAPIAPLFHWSICYLKKPHIKNIQFSPSGGIFFERLCLE